MYLYTEYIYIANAINEHPILKNGWCQIIGIWVDEKNVFSRVKGNVVINPLWVTQKSIMEPQFVRLTLRANFENLACSQFPGCLGVKGRGWQEGLFRTPYLHPCIIHEHSADTQTVGLKIRPMLPHVQNLWRRSVLFGMWAASSSEEKTGNRRASMRGEANLGNTSF